MYPKHIIILLILIIQSNATKLRFLDTKQGIIERKTYSEEKKKAFSQLRKYVSQESSKFPKNYDSLITNLGAKTEFKMGKTPIKKIDFLNLPRQVKDKFKAVKYSKGSVTYELIKYNVYTGSVKVNNFFGIASRLNQNELFYAYVNGNSYADPLQQYNYINVKSCSRFLFWENCKNNKVPQEREFTKNEISTIQQALIVKFNQVLSTILDLDKQLILSAFKKVSSVLKKKPPSSINLILDTKTFMDLKTLVASNLNSLKNYGITDICIKTISNIMNKDRYYTSFYDVLDKKDESIKIIFGVALRMNNQLIVSFIKGTAVCDTHHAVCPLFSPVFKEKQKLVPKRRYPPYYKSICENYNKGKNFDQIKRDYEGKTITDDQKRIISATMFGKMSQFLDHFLNGISF